MHEVMASGRLCYNYKNTSIAHVQKVWRSGGWGSWGRDEGDGNSTWGVCTRGDINTRGKVYTLHKVYTRGKVCNQQGGGYVYILRPAGN